jgi:hypothetical protein
MIEDTGCPRCSMAMQQRGSVNLCLDCQYEYWQWQAEMAEASRRDIPEESTT